MGNNCFGVNHIKKVIIHENVNLIKPCPFGCNPNLESIDVDVENRHYSSDAQHILYDKKQTRLIQVPTAIEVVRLPSTIKYIEYQCIDSGQHLKTLYITGNIISSHSISIKASSLQNVYYFGTKKVSSIFYEVSPKVIVCTNYKGTTFGGIVPERIGYCKPQGITVGYRRDTAIFLYLITVLIIAY